MGNLCALRSDDAPCPEHACDERIAVLQGLSGEPTSPLVEFHCPPGDGDEPMKGGRPSLHTNPNVSAFTQAVIDWK
jgi:hypothetical protein